MPESAAAEFVIQGITHDGKAFRPSDWAERLCGVMAAFGGDHRMQYSPFVHPVTVNGVRCVVVDMRRRSPWLKTNRYGEIAGPSSRTAEPGVSRCPAQRIPMISRENLAIPAGCREGGGPPALAPPASGQPRSNATAAAGPAMVS